MGHQSDIPGLPDVTELDIARRNLELAEERARLAVDAVGLGTFDLDITTGVSVTSERFARIFGLDRPASRKDYLKAFHPDDRQLRDDAHVRALNTGRLEYEARIIWPDGSVHWIRTEGKVYYDENKPLRIVGVLWDITEQRRDKEEKQKLVTLVDNSVDLMSVLEFNGMNSYLNAAGRKMLGFDSDEEVQNTPIANLHTAEDFKQVEREVIPSVMNQGRWSGTMMVTHLKTGERFPVLNNCIRIDDPVTGVPMAVGAVMRDLRPELAAIAGLKESEEHLRLATTAAQLGTFDMNVLAGTLEWDTRCRELFGIFSERPVDYHNDFVNGLHEDDRDRVSKVTAAAFEREKTAGNYDVDFRTVGFEDQKVRWVRARGKVFFNDNGAPLRFIGTVLDITDQKLEEIRKNDFIAMVSHELKTPLTSIKSYIQLVLNRSVKAGDSTAANMLSRAEAQTNKMVSLVSGFLDIARLENGRMPLNRSWFRLDQLIQEAYNEVLALYDSHPVIVLEPVTVMVYADKDKLSQVLVNLLTNAFKYSPPGRPVTIGSAASDASVQVWVKDEGIGIRPEDKDKLFERFYRVDDGAMQSASGFGIGLYLVSEIVALHGGTIGLDSMPGVGSTFTVTMPVS